MSLLRKINSLAKSEINTGFGINTSDYGGRFVNKEGNANIEKRGLGFLERVSWYHTMLALSRWKFFSVIFLFYILVNLLFAVIYYLIGVNHLSGTVSNSGVGKFAEAFFFSCQTFTTVGYGRINPVGFTASSIASIEALLGLLSFALATGLLYGRFAKPKAYLRFSENALLAPYKDITAIMFRVAPFKNTTLTDAECKVTLGMAIEDDGKMLNKFFPLELEFNIVNTLTLSWTIVHPITESSPLYKFTADDYANSNGEILIFLKAFDDMFSNIVVARTSYTFKEIIIGAKFNPMYKRSQNGDRTILYLDKLNSYSTADVGYSFSQKEKITG
ncbi:MAG: ion channel [Bacteroidota bacterium]|nr:ion channel [Bacteroidota bacterium]